MDVFFLPCKVTSQNYIQIILHDYLVTAKFSVIVIILKNVESERRNRVSAMILGMNTEIFGRNPVSNPKQLRKSI